MDLHELEQLAQDLVCRVRDDDPEANGRWVSNVTTEQDRFALLFVLAAAVPDDRTWNELTAWTVVKSLTPADDGLDHVAIERAMTGERVKLTLAERHKAVELLSGHGLSNRQIGRRLGITDRSVHRHLHKTAAAPSADATSTASNARPPARLTIVSPHRTVAS